MIMNRREFLCIGGRLAAISLLPSGCVTLPKETGARGEDMNRDPRIEAFGPIELMGVIVQGTIESGPEDRAWGLFGATANEASISRVGKDIYGLHIYHPRFPKPSELMYMACMEKEPGIRNSDLIPHRKHRLQSTPIPPIVGYHRI